MRTRIFGRFAELRAEREQLQAQLDALTAATPQPADISLLDQLPPAGNPLPRLTAQHKALLFQALNLEILRNPADRQATVWVEITDTTIQAIPAILDPAHDGHHDTNPDQPEPTCHFDKHLEQVQRPIDTETGARTTPKVATLAVIALTARIVWLTAAMQAVPTCEFPPAPAAPGWDAVTGWGTPDAQVLVPLLAR